MPSWIWTASQRSLLMLMLAEPSFWAEERAQGLLLILCPSGADVHAETQSWDHRLSDSYMEFPGGLVGVRATPEAERS